MMHMSYGNTTHPFTRIQIIDKGLDELAKIVDRVHKMAGTQDFVSLLVNISWDFLTISLHVPLCYGLYLLCNIFRGENLTPVIFYEFFHPPLQGFIGSI